MSTSDSSLAYPPLIFRSGDAYGDDKRATSSSEGKERSGSRVPYILSDDEAGAGRGNIFF